MYKVFYKTAQKGVKYNRTTNFGAQMDALLLDQNYQAVSIVDWRRAFKLLSSDKAERIGDNVIKTIVGAQGQFEVPSVLRLRRPISYNCYSDRVRFSRRNVLARDLYKCQYCGEHLTAKGGTVDHVLPRSRGGRTDYLNCVACCRHCNNIKRDHTPEEAGMVLKTKPRRPNFIMLYTNAAELPDEWRMFIRGMSNG